MEKIFLVEGMHCSHCASRVEKALSALGYKAEITLDAGKVRVEGDSIDCDKVKNEIEDLGFIVK